MSEEKAIEGSYREVGANEPVAGKVENISVPASQLPQIEVSPIIPSNIETHKRGVLGRLFNRGVVSPNERIAATDARISELSQRADRAVWVNEVKLQQTNLSFEEWLKTEDHGNDQQESYVDTKMAEMKARLGQK